MKSLTKLEKWAIGLIAIFALIILGGLAGGGGKQRPSGNWITRQQFGEDWPFAVDAGKLECRQIPVPAAGRNFEALVFTANGKTYAINGNNIVDSPILTC